MKNLFFTVFFERDIERKGEREEGGFRLHKTLAHKANKKFETL